MRSLVFFRALLCTVLLSTLIFTGSFSQTLSGTYTIPGTVAGNTVTNLTDLANLIDGGVTVNGTAIFEFTSSYTDKNEVFPIIFIPWSGTGNVVIRPAASVTTPLVTLGSPLNAYYISFYGADNLTFDGRPGGLGTTSEWQFENGAYETYFPTFDFVNGAAHDTLEYISILASTSYYFPAVGTVQFDTSNVAGGNSNNVIQNCNIGDYNGTPYTQIYSYGTTANPNSNNKILNNNIYDFQAYGYNEYGGVFIAGTGNGSNWVISGNSFYAKYIYYTDGLSAIYFGPGSTSTNNTISGNYIGGQQPLCGGGYWKFYGNTGNSNPSFQGIYVNAGKNTSVSKNTIQNMLMDDPQYSQIFIGINIVGGNTNVDSNIIGNATDTNSIHVGNVGVLVGIWNQAPDTVTINGNTLANLTLDNATPSSSTTTGDLIGIYGYSAGSVVGPNTIINNKVFNLSGNTTYNNDFYYAINSGYGTNANEISGNFQNMIAGIYLQTSSASNQVISENKVHDILMNVAGGENLVYIYGITVSCGAGAKTQVNGNLVYGMYAPNTYGSSNYYLGIAGIYLWSDFAGAYTVSNNMVDLGLKPTDASSVQNSSITGIWDNTSSSSNSMKIHIYHNSVYIGGADLNTYSNNLSSYAFRRDVTGGPVYDSLDIKNNIFMSSRTTTSSLARNYSIYLNSTSAVASDYNDIFGTGSTYEFGGVGSTNYPTFTSWKVGVPGFDTHSINKQPQYLSDSTATPNLHVQLTSPIDMAGTATATIVYDIDSFVRANYTPVDIGAAVINACVNTVTPTVTLVPSQNNVCKGTSIIFTADTTNAGSAPTYNFYLDGTSVQNGASNTYTNTTLNNNDSVRVVMTSNASCLTSATATSADVVAVIKTNVTTSDTVTICSGSNYDGHTATGTYKDTFNAANGCDSIRTLLLTVKPNSTQSVTITQCGGNYDGHTITGTYIDTFPSFNGCDSIRTLHLTINPVKQDSVTAVICQGLNYDGHTATGTYFDTLLTSKSCDSIRVLFLTVKPIVRDSVISTLCSGKNYDGHTTSGTYIDSFTTANTCDSIRTLFLTISPSIRTSITQAICSGQNYDGYTTTGTFIDTFPSFSGCDSIRTLNLTVNSTLRDTIIQSLCAGQTYDGHSTTGTYIDTFIIAGGCDSIRTLNLTINPIVRDTVSATICQGQNYDKHTTTGTYIDTLSTSKSCDSVRVLILTVNQNVHDSITQSLCTGQSYYGHTTTGTFVDTFNAANTCDSIRTLFLTINPVIKTSFNYGICSGQSYEGHTITGTYTDTFPSSNGCDSIRTVNLTVNTTIKDTVNHTICQGQTYLGHTVSGTFIDTFQAVGGCDSIRTLILNVQQIIHDTIAKDICTGDSYAGHNQTGTYTDTYQSIYGCDSIRTVNLTVHAIIDTTVTKTICEGERYGTHSTSGIFTDTLQSQYACDSIRTVILTVLPRSITSYATSICNGQSYSGHNTSGVYVDTFGAANGCDSIRTLTLTVASQIKTIVDDTICQGSNDFGYTQSGFYIDTFNAVGGCDSIRTLNLLVIPSIYTTYTTTICHTQAYGGHDSSGTYVDTLTAVTGCDSIRTLYLTVLPFKFGINKVQICQGASFEGHYTSGEYVDTLAGAASNHCDSVVTLELNVIAPPAVPIISQVGDTLISTAASHYQWYQSGTLLQGDTSQEYTITVEGSYTVQVTDSNGCSSMSAVYTAYRTGITQVQDGRTRKIFPNPASEEVNITLNGVDQNSQVSLKMYDATGKIIYVQQWQPTGESEYEHINLHTFAEGLYLIQVTQGDWAVSQRIVISR